MATAATAPASSHFTIGYKPLTDSTYIDPSYVAQQTKRRHRALIIGIVVIALAVTVTCLAFAGAIEYKNYSYHLDCFTDYPLYLGLIGGLFLLIRISDYLHNRKMSASSSAHSIHAEVDPEYQTKGLTIDDNILPDSTYVDPSYVAQQTKRRHKALIIGIVAIALAVVVAYLAIAGAIEYKNPLYHLDCFTDYPLYLGLIGGLFLLLRISDFLHNRKMRQISIHPLSSCLDSINAKQVHKTPNREKVNSQQISPPPGLIEALGGNEAYQALPNFDLAKINLTNFIDYDELSHSQSFQENMDSPIMKGTFQSQGYTIEFIVIKYEHSLLEDTFSENNSRIPEVLIICPQEFASNPIPMNRDRWNILGGRHILQCPYMNPDPMAAEGLPIVNQESYKIIKLLYEGTKPRDSYSSENPPIHISSLTSRFFITPSRPAT